METFDPIHVLRERMSETGLSVADVAFCAGINRQQLDRYLSGESQPSVGVWVQLMSAVGLMPDASPSREWLLTEMSERVARRAQTLEMQSSDVEPRVVIRELFIAARMASLNG